MRGVAIVITTAAFGVLGAAQLPLAARAQAPLPGESRTAKGLYLAKVVEPGYEVTVTETERGENYSVLDIKGFVPTVTAGGTILFRALYVIGKERGFTHVFVVPSRQPPPAGRTEKGRDISAVTKVFLLKDPKTPLKELLGGEYSDNAQQLFNQQGYLSVAQLGVLSGGRGGGHTPQ
jgi:hypothetical protein